MKYASNKLSSLDTRTRDCVQPEDRKVQTMHEMKRSETKEGMINYLARFMPHHANNKTLRSLLKEDTKLQWSTKHENDWNEIKTVLTNKSVLVYFDPRKQTNISPDASKSASSAVKM